MRSDMIKKGMDRAPHRSLLYAAGVKTSDLDKPFIGVCNSYIDIIPGHKHLNQFRGGGERSHPRSWRHSL